MCIHSRHFRYGTFDEQRHERNDGTLQLANVYAIVAMIARRVDKAFQLSEDLAGLGRELLPSERQTADRYVA